MKVNVIVPILPEVRNAVAAGRTTSELELLCHRCHTAAWYVFDVPPLEALDSLFSGRSSHITSNFLRVTCDNCSQGLDVQLTVVAARTRAPTTPHPN